MMKRIILSTIISLFSFLQIANAAVIDTSYFAQLKAYDWQPISDADKVLQYENSKDLTKRSIDQSKLAESHYVSGVKLMESKNYNGAIAEFKSAMKRYKRAKLSDNALNFIRVNMSLSYANTGNKQDLIIAKRFLDLVTSKILTSKEWTYNIAIARDKIGEQNEASKLLSNLIRKDEFNFQSYLTLSKIYRDSGNDDEADKVEDRMKDANQKLIEKKNKIKNKDNTSSIKTKSKSKNKKSVVKAKGKKPNVNNLIIVKKVDHLKFNKIEKIDDRSMTQIQIGVSEYADGVIALSKKDYATAQDNLKEAEKKLKRGKVSNDGLNFSRADLTIALLASGEKRGVGQAKRYLMNITSKLYQKREWAYNMAVAHYNFGSRSRGATKEDFLKRSVKLFKTSIQLDKLFLPAYENLIYVYRQLGESNKAQKTQKAFLKNRDRLMNSFSKSDQANLGMKNPYVFRVNLGSFGEYDTPLEVFDQSYLITVPLSEKITSYLSGMFYNLKEAEDYKEKMQKIGFNTAKIVAFKDGEKLDF